MRHLTASTALLIAAALSSAAHAEEQEWTLRIKKEAQQLSIQLGGTHLYGSGANRIKGSGNVVSKARSVAPFSKLRVDGPVDVRLAPGAQEGVSVRADDNLEPYITTVVEGDTLVVGIKPGSSFSTKNELVVAIDFKQLQRVQLRGSGDARIDRVKGDRFEAELSGSGDLSIGLLEVKELSARLSGSGDVSVAGQAEQQDWELSGSGDVAAASLSGRKVKARLSGSGDLRLGVSQELDAQISGSGDLSYSGRPSVKSQVSGSGELIAR
jgi:Putative auto-transporter adhesin, head GIN domain